MAKLTMQEFWKWIDQDLFIYGIKSPATEADIRTLYRDIISRIKFEKSVLMYQIMDKQAIKDEIIKYLRRKEYIPI